MPPRIHIAVGITGSVWFPDRPCFSHILRSGPQRWILAGIAAAQQRTVCSLLTFLLRHRRSIAELLWTRVPLRWRPGEATFLETFPPPSPGGEVRDIRTRILPSSSELAFGRGRISCSRPISRTPSTGIPLGA